MEFVLIPAGAFMMGSDDNDRAADRGEKPQHKVDLSKPFYLGKYEVTQAQWKAVMGSNPSKFKGKSNPVEQVSWEDVQEFIKRLNQKENTSKYRLPTEAEWEYAARAGSESVYFFGDDSSQLGAYAWYGESEKGSSHPVGKKQPNAWGLHDMHGNVMEWVQDWYGERYYLLSPAADPPGRASSSYSFRVSRGGSWDTIATGCRSAVRFGYPSALRSNFIGFRLALSSE